MTAGITLTIAGVPVAQPRQRHRLLQLAGRTLSQNYTPAQHPVQTWKAEVALAWQRANAGPPLEGPVHLSVQFVLPRPQSLCRKKDSDDRIWHTKKPDGDNLLKSLKDALSGLAWRDDSQVCQVWCSKWYAARDEQPHAFIHVRPIEETTT